MGMGGVSLLLPCMMSAVLKTVLWVMHHVEVNTVQVLTLTQL